MLIRHSNPVRAGIFYALLFFVTFLFAFQFLSLLKKKTWVQLSRFVAGQADYDQIRSGHPIYRELFALDNVIPEKAHVNMVPTGRHYYYVLARYLLYPRTMSHAVSNDWDVQLRLKDADGVDLKDERALKAAARVVAVTKEGAVVKGQTASGPGKPFTKAFITFLIVAGGQLAAGMCLMFRAKVPVQETGLFAYGSFAYLGGFLLLTSLLWIILLAHVPLSRGLVLGLWVALPAAGCVFFRKEFGETWRVFQARGASVFQGKKNAPGYWACALYGGIFIAVVTIACAPVFDWDALSHWLFKSKAFFEHRALYFGETHHNGYPILWPLNIAAQYALFGAEYDALASLSNAVTYACLLAQVLGVFKRVCFAPMAYASAVMLFGAFAFNPTMFWATPKNSLTAFLCAGLYGLVIWLQTGKREFFYLGLGMVMATGLCKMEGMVMAFVVGGSLMAVCRKVDAKSARAIVYTMVLPAVLFLCWQLWLSQNGFGIRNTHFVESISLPKIVFLVSVQMDYAFLSHFNELMYGIIIFLPVVLVRARLSEHEKLFLAVFFALMVFSGFATVGESIATIENSFYETFARLSFPAVMVLVFFWASRLSNEYADRAKSRKCLDDGTQS